MNWKKWASLVGAAAVGGAIGYLQANMTSVLSGQTPWKQMALGAASAAAIAVVHLLQQSPLPAPEAAKS